MLRDFIRDRGTQLTLGTFVATFFYCVLVLVAIGPDPAATSAVTDHLNRGHVTGPYRTLTQDVSFGVDQLVEIAIRALSPRSTTPSPR